MRPALNLTVALLLLAAVVPAGAQAKNDRSEEILRQRLLLKERFNKGWDVQMENSRDRIEGRCKGEAKKRYSAIRVLKRRQYVKECIARLRG